MENLFVLILTLIASTVGTITGFGTSTILVPTLSLQYPLTETLLFVGVVHWFGDIWKMVFFKKGANWKLIFLFGFTGIIVSYISSRLAGYVSGGIKLTNYSFPTLIAAVIVSLVGAYTAKQVVNKIPQEKFRM